MTERLSIPVGQYDGEVEGVTSHGLYLYTAPLIVPLTHTAPTTLKGEQGIILTCLSSLMLYKEKHAN